MAWALLLVGAVSLFRRIETVPERLRSGCEYGAWAILTATGLFGVWWVLYPVVQDQTVYGVTRIAGSALCVLTTLFLLGTPVWSPARTLLPAGVGLLVASGFNVALPFGARAGRALPYAVVAGVAVAAAAVWLVLDGGAPRPGAGRRLVRLGGFALMAAAVATVLALFLPWAQPHVEQAAAQALSGSSPTAYAGLSTTSRLGQIEELALSHAVVLRVFGERPQRLRARVLTDFNGIQWSGRPGPLRPLAPAPPSLALAPDLADWLADVPGALFVAPGPAGPPGPDAVRSRIVQSVFNAGALVTPAGTRLVRLPDTAPKADAAGVLEPSARDIETYALVNLPESVAGEEPSAACLAVPADADPRLRELAEQLAAGAGPVERIRRTTAHLERECVYSLKVGRFRTRQPVAEFLFEKKRGYCEYFASAAALLLRLQGVPTRYVTGFHVGDDNFEGGHYVVREADAHAWIEAWVAGRGWVEVDPTPAAQYSAVHASRRGGWLSSLVEWAKGRLSRAAATVAAGDWRVTSRWARSALRGLLTSPVALAGLAALAWVAYRRRRQRARTAPRAAVPGGATVPPGLVALVARVDRLCDRGGWRRPASRALLEHLDALPDGALTTEGREACRRVVASFYRARFGGAPVPPEEIRALEEAMK